MYFFTSFPFFVSSIFQFLCRQLTHTAGNTSRSVFACCQNSTLSLFFRFEAFSFFRKSPRFLPASAGRILPASFLSIHKPELRVPDCRPHASRTFFFQSILSLSLAITLSSGVSRPYLTSSILPIRKPEPRAPACRPLLQIYHTYLTYKSQPLTFGSAGQHYFNHQPFPRRPPPSSDASGLPPFPSTLPQPSTPPISHFFFFFFLPPFFFFSFFFFLSSFPFFFFFFSLLFLVYTFFFLAFFYLLFCFFHFFFLSIFFITSPCTFFMCTSPKDVKQNAVM